MDKYNYELGQDTAGLKREMPDANGESVYIGSHVILQDIGFYPAGGFMDSVFKKLNGKTGQINRIFLPAHENFSEATAKVIFADGNSVFCHPNEIVVTDKELTPAYQLKSLQVDPRKEYLISDKNDKQLGLFGSFENNNVMTNAEL